MMSLKQQMQSYGAYHKDPRNKMTHFVGVPLVTFSLFLALGWFRFVRPRDPPDLGGDALLPGGRDLLLAAGLVRRADAAPDHAGALAGLRTGSPPAVRPGRSRSSWPRSCWDGSSSSSATRSRAGVRRWPTTSSRSSTRPLFLTIEVLAAVGVRKDLYESEARGRDWRTSA